MDFGTILTAIASFGSKSLSLFLRRKKFEATLTPNDYRYFNDESIVSLRLDFTNQLSKPIHLVCLETVSPFGMTICDYRAVVSPITFLGDRIQIIEYPKKQKYMVGVFVEPQERSTLDISCYSPSFQNKNVRTIKLNMVLADSGGQKTRLLKCSLVPPS